MAWKRFYLLLWSCVGEACLAPIASGNGTRLPLDQQHPVDRVCRNQAVTSYVEQGRFMLLEKLAVDIVEIALTEPKTLVARVEVDKPHALRFADSVAIVRCGHVKMPTRH